MMNEEFLTLTIGKQKNIALIAHDSKKPGLSAGAKSIRMYLKSFSVRYRHNGKDDYR